MNYEILKQWVTSLASRQARDLRGEEMGAARPAEARAKAETKTKAVFRHSLLFFLLCLTLASGLSLATASPTHAQTVPPLTKLIPEECLGEQKGPNAGAGQVCDISSAIKLGINVTKIMLGLLGSVALLMFTYGGLVWLISAGNSARVKEGQDIFKNAVIGIAIVLGAYLIISAVLSVITGTNFGEAIKLFPGNNARTPFQI